MKRINVEIRHEYVQYGEEGAHEIHYLVEVDEADPAEVSAKILPTLVQRATEKAVTTHLSEYFLDPGDILTVISAWETALSAEEFLEAYGSDGYVVRGTE